MIMQKIITGVFSIWCWFLSNRLIIIAALCSHTSLKGWSQTPVMMSLAPMRRKYISQNNNRFFQPYAWFVRNIVIAITITLPPKSLIMWPLECGPEFVTPIYIVSITLSVINIKILALMKRFFPLFRKRDG